MTNFIPKPLLPVVGKPMMEYLLDKIYAVDEIDEVFIVTNNKFYPHFEFWLGRLKEAGVYDLKITLINDNTIQDGKKLGAIGDMQFVINKCRIDDDLLILAGDNLFEFNLNEFIDYFDRKRANVVALRDVKDREVIKRYGVVELNPDNKFLGFEEKPKEPKSTLASTCVYIINKKTLKRIKEYLDKGNNPDVPGNFINWLYKNDDIYGWVFSESWFDIGSLQQFEEANLKYGGI